MTTASDLYTFRRTGPGVNDFRIEPRRPIQTSDSATFGRERRERSSLTRDERLDPMTSGQTISRGKYWDGTGVNPTLDEKVAPIRAFVRGFIPGNIVDAESPGTVIGLGRVYLPQVADGEQRESLMRAHDEAEEEWKKDKRSGSELVGEDAARARAAKDAEQATRGVPGTSPSNLVATTFTPGSDKTTDGRQPMAPRGMPAATYQENLRKHRATQDQAAPAKVTTAKDYAATLRAGRAAKGA
jgi:hypothetical protein